MITNINDVKIPYWSEGTIRTAQLDDTVAPTNSVQLAVNMNFDCVGAAQTRDGVSEFATQLDDGITNFGVLNNKIPLDGYADFFKLGTNTVFDASVAPAGVSAAKIDSTHYIVFWRGAANDGFVQVAEGNLTTGAITMLGTPLEFDAVDNDFNECIMVDATHFLNVWQGPGINGFAQTFAVNTTTWAVTAVGTAFEFDSGEAHDMSLAQIDASHFIMFYGTTAYAGTSMVLEVNLSTFAVTKPGSSLTFDATATAYNSCKAIGNGTHFINFWQHNSGEGYAQAFSVNTSTWAITAIGTAVSFDYGRYNSAQPLGDGEHFINFWQGGSDGLVQVFNVNPSTFAVTKLNTELSFTTANGIGNSSVAMGDGEHFVNIWLDNPGPVGFAQLFEVNQTTYVVTPIDVPVSTGSEGVGIYRSAVAATAYRVVNFQSSGASTGIAGMFSMESVPTAQHFLYAQKDNGDIVNWNGSSWTTRRSSLSTTGKARFAQYLNYLWMVNGNEIIGDPVMTSNGGNFGTTLVPADFPPGDFIHAGFEGRVWVADSEYGIIYYTDIVQFTPPSTYSITYDPDVNFISNLSPQDGESFTGLYRVPRALLVFTQNHIYRIYGATSVDAYPAYFVGTYSQESIVSSKTGIFFHHSSGFYQFDYGGQPVEISRRIIDFVQAIPRSYYENITSVYDGFDAVEWSVGPVTVEGVYFENCVARYTISTQVWTIYNYVGNTITAMISYDNGTTLSNLMGTSTGKVGKLDDGFTDFGEPFHYDLIDRWRSFTEMYTKEKDITGVNVYSENAAGASIMYQVQKNSVNTWQTLGAVNEQNNSLLPNASTEDFDVMRFRIAGTTRGTRVLIHGIELVTVQDKGYPSN